MAATRTAARKKTARKAAAKRAPRKAVGVRPPRGGTWQQRVAIRFALLIARAAETRRDAIRTRKDAAILRATHKGCTKCVGTGTIYTKGKDGRLTGSKPCSAKPATIKVSKMAVARQARFGADKHSGLLGWRCPCGTKEKPRYRDAKTATAAIRTHERKSHGGQTVGAAWYAQLPEQTPGKTPAKAPSPAPKTTAISKTTAKAPAGRP